MGDRKLSEELREQVEHCMAANETEPGGHWHRFALKFAEWAVAAERLEEDARRYRELAN